MISEMKSPAADSPLTADGKELAPQSLAAIRDVMEEAPKVKKRPMRKIAVTAAQPKKETWQPFWSLLDEPATQRARPKSESLPLIADPVAPKTSTKPGVLDVVKARVAGVNVKPKHGLMLLGALVVFLRPWLVFWTLVFGIVVVAGLFITVGHDTFWKHVMRLARRYAKRHPERAERMHRRLDTFAVHWDRVLDVFPDGTVDGLYLPDFSDLARAESRHDEALDRRFATLKEG